MNPIYGLTWDEMGVTPSHRSWQMLRALRHDPPHLARDDPGRRSMFSAAVEQSEQFFRAAETVDTETRPLLLFYGLSQSGRALRAAADPNGDWDRARGHGLSVVGSSIGGLASTRVADQKSGLFIDVARTLQRATLGDGQNVATLTRLAQIGSSFPLPGDDPDYPPLLLTLHDRGPYDRPEFLRAELTVPAEGWARELPPVGQRDTSDYEAYKDHVRAQLSHYPTLSEARLVDDVPGHFDLGGSGSTRSVQLMWSDRRHPAPAEEAEALLPFGDDWGSETTVYPIGPGSSLAVHPFLLWWSVLYAMSHYVRYEPTRWAAIIDIDSSSEAAAVEHLCHQALDLLPEMIHRTLLRPRP